MIEKSDFTLYYEKFKNIPTLKPDEERELLVRIADGDKEAERIFINANVRLVMFRVLQFVSHEDPRAMDLVSDGTMGLLKAVRRFDVSRGFRFSTYAVWWINCYIRRQLMFFKKERTGTLGNLNKQYESAVRVLKVTLGGTPAPEDVAHYLNWSTNTLRIYQKFRTDPQLISHLTSTSPNLPSNEEGPAECAAKRDTKSQITTMLSRLAPVEEDVIRRYYGLGHMKHTYDQIAAFYDMTKEWVRQTEVKALRKLFILYKEKDIPMPVVNKRKTRRLVVKLNRALSKLSAIEEDVLRRIRGLGCQQQSQEELEAFYGFTAEKVKSIYKTANDKFLEIIRKDQEKASKNKKTPPSGGKEESV